MKLWMALYEMVWVALIEFLLVMTPGGSSVLIYLHSIDGAVKESYDRLDELLANMKLREEL